MSRASCLAVLCALHAPALGSPRSDPTVGRAVFTGATLPNATSIDLNPAALGLGIPDEVYAAVMATLDNYSIDRKHLDLDTGALSSGEHVGSTLLSPGGMIAYIWHPGGSDGRITLAPALRSSPAERFIPNQQALRYYTLGGEHRVYELAIAGSLKLASRFHVGVSLASQPSFLKLRYARDTALEAARDPARGIASDCDGAPCGVENPAATELYAVDVQSSLLSVSNFALNVGFVWQIARPVWLGLAYHTPPGLAVQNQLDGTMRVDRAPRDGGGTVDGASTVYLSQPPSFDLELRVRLPGQLDFHLGSRFEYLTRMQMYDVRGYGAFFPGAGIPEWMPRARGLHEDFALWAGVEQVEQNTLEPEPWRVGGRIGFETSALDDDRTSPFTIAPTSFTADVGVQLRINPFVLQLTAGVQYFPRVSVTDSAFDPRARLTCADSGFDYTTAACEAVRHGYGLPTAAGDYERWELATRLAIHYEP